MKRPLRIQAGSVRGTCPVGGRSGETAEAEQRMQLDRVPGHTRLPVREVEERHPGGDDRQPGDSPGAPRACLQTAEPRSNWGAPRGHRTTFTRGNNHLMSRHGDGPSPSRARSPRGPAASPWGVGEPEFV